jgi:transposase-like protein
VVAELRAVMRPLQGNLILVSKAAKKYGFHSNSIYDWIRNGWVTVLVPEPRRQVDEGDIALARAIANKQGQVSGRAIFPAKPRSGRPRKQQP